MLLPIEAVTIKITDVDGAIDFMTLDAPNGENPFYFQLEEVQVRGKYRDRNKILRRGETYYTVRWFYNYASHDMDLRLLLTAKEIELAAPPSFREDEYTTYNVKFVNQEAIKNYLGMPGGGQTYESFDTIPSAGVTLEFELLEPIAWDAVMALAWFQSPET